MNIISKLTALWAGAKAKIIVGLIWVVVTVFLILLIRHLLTENTELTKTNAVLEAKNASTEDQARRFANRPRTDDDVVRRLCAWADRADRDQGTAKRNSPAVHCP